MQCEIDPATMKCKTPKPATDGKDIEQPIAGANIDTKALSEKIQKDIEASQKTGIQLVPAESMMRMIDPAQMRELLKTIPDAEKLPKNVHPLPSKELEK